MSDFCRTCGHPMIHPGYLRTVVGNPAGAAILAEEIAEERFIERVAEAELIEEVVEEAAEAIFDVGGDGYGGGDFF